MVRLYKTPSDFGACKLRDSFLRQFLGPEDVVASTLQSSTFSPNPALNSLAVSGSHYMGPTSVAAGSCVKNDVSGVKVVDTLHRHRFKSSGLPVQRKQLVRNIIRFV